MRIRLLLTLLLVLTACAQSAGPPPAQTPSDAAPSAPAAATAEILWDSYGVPHIGASDLGALAYGFGWAQAHAHGDLVLRLYGQARGRAAEYWGEDFADSDRWMRINGIPQRARDWLAQASEEERIVVDGFVAGFNGYAAANPGALDATMARALPVLPEDILAHAQRVLQYTFMASPQYAAAAQRHVERAGSNAWALAPARTAAGNALLLANPHLPWGDLFTWFEVQLQGGGIDAYGVTLVGLPLISVGFNQRLGWTHTVNTHDGADLYELALTEGGYRWNGGERAFDVRMDTLRVRRADGSIDAQPFPVRSSVHGPVIAQNEGRAVALRVAGLDRPHLIAQTLGMLRARNLAQFEDALRMLQLPMFTVVYADADGHIMHLFNGVVPRRPRGDFARWQGVLPGDTSAWLWTDALAYHELPRLVDPATGWVQNANEPPWTATLPMPLDPADYPAYVAPPPSMSFRAQSSARLLASDSAMTLDAMLALKHSTRLELAARVRDDVVQLARATSDADARAGAEALAAWDLNTDNGSRGAVLFVRFWSEYVDASGFRTFADPWSAAEPLATPAVPADTAALLRALADATREVRAQYGAADVAWGEVYRLPPTPGAGLLPSNGASGYFGAFRVTNYGDDTDGRYIASGGDSWYAAIEFGDRPRARALLSYGNASQPGSPHRGDQLPLYARKQMRDVLLTRAAVEAEVQLRHELTLPRR